MAADRSDDIKQLFSHLGLNPGDYQEIREKSRAAPRGESLMPTAAKPTPPTVIPAAAPPPTVQIAPTVPVLAPVPTVAPLPPVHQAPAVASFVPPSPAAATAAAAAGADLSTRWSLLRAAVETPTRVAQIARSPTTTAPVDMPAPAEDAPTRRLFQELSRRPVDEAVDQLTEAARRRWQQPPQAPPPQPASAGPGETRVWQQPVQSPPILAAEPEAAPQPVASGELLSTFQRLVAPSSVPQQKPARMRFNYQADAKAPRAMQAREENLDDVFSRISDPRFPR
ncbi:BcsR/BcsP family cellulose biosynthesis protein [Hydrocarboniphaga sp.]|uniref:BcsR/BcsP family cellulose biosynthesis protein n=1 Tax=Hydrocarboniphaga sp. TaxID=2033016 RepID=UPI003D14358F